MEDKEKAKQIHETIKKWANDRAIQINSDRGNLLLNDVLAVRTKDCLQDITFLLNAVGDLAEIISKK